MTLLTELKTADSTLNGESAVLVKVLEGIPILFCLFCQTS